MTPIRTALMRARRALRVAALFCVVLLTCQAPAAAQETTATLTGRLVDMSGAPIPQAVIHVSDGRHGVDRTDVTDYDGYYRIADLPPSTYAVTVDGVGDVWHFTYNGMLTVGATVRFDFQLVPTFTDVDYVDSSLPALQRESADLSMVIDRQRIESLPLNRRDFLQLALLAPGVSGPVEGSELSSRGAVAMHANGGREDFNNFLLDGVDNNDPYVNRYVVQPSVDSVEEFKIATNSYSAEYGRSAAGQVNVVTRRGTNQLQGSLYEYFRNRALNARNYFEGDEKQPFTRNQLGGGLGGRLIENRTFFFGSLDALRERAGLSRLGTVPADAARLGDLSGLGKTIIDPFTGAPFPDGVIPPSRISPVARHILELFPEANRAGAPNYLGEPAGRTHDYQGNIRIDHQASASDLLTMRYSRGQSDLLEPYTGDAGTTAGFGDVVHDRTWNLMAQHQRTFAKATNSLRFGANRFGRDLLTENHDRNAGADWGVTWLNVPTQSFGYPVIDVAGYSRVGDAYSLPLIRDARTYQVSDTLAFDRGRHFFKVGGEARHLRLDSQVDLFSRGQLSFTGAFTGTGLGDLLLGFPTFGLQAKADNPIRMRTNAFSLFAQDDWRVKSDLTVNLGVRYEYVAPPIDARDGMSTLNLATRKIVQVGTNGLSRSGIDADRNNIAPRVGISWTPYGGPTVFRGGYGVFYDSGMFTVNTAGYFNPPQFNLRVFFPSEQNLLTLANPFPANGGFTPPATVSMLSPDLVNGYLQHWNVAFQTELSRYEGAPVGVVSVAYAGSKGSRLIRARNLNQPVPGAGDVDPRRPFAGLSDIFFVESEGRSRYDSLQVSFDRRLSHGFSFLAAYTLATSNDDASAFLGTPSDKNYPQDSRNPDAEWGPSSFDVRHRFTLAFVIQLPENNGWTRGTSIQGMTVVRSGLPFTPILRFDNSNTGNVGGSTAGSDRPNQTGDAAVDDPTPDQWFNTGAFSVAAPYTFGNAGRNSVRGPVYASFDFGVARKIRLGAATVDLGLQAFNLFNRTNFDLPEHFVDEPTTFGRIFSAQAPRQLQLMARLGF